MTKALFFDGEKFEMLPRCPDGEPGEVRAGDTELAVSRVCRWFKIWENVRFPSKRVHVRAMDIPAMKGWVDKGVDPGDT